MPVPAKYVSSAVNALNDGIAADASRDDQLTALRTACGILLDSIHPSNESYRAILREYWVVRDTVAAANDEARDEALLAFREWVAEEVETDVTPLAGPFVYGSQQNRS